MNPNDTPSTVGTQARSNPGDGEGWRSREGQREGLVDEAVDAARKVYHEGERYLRTAYDRLPADMDRYVSRPAQEHPLIGIAIGAAVGYLIAYLIHGSETQWRRSGVPDYARMRDPQRY
jgi:hypothetical protein